MNGGIGVINSNNNALTASYVNHFRIAACADRLALHVRAAPKNDAVEFFNLCLSLARGIDYAIANKEVPTRAMELPLLLKQVCRLRNDSFVQAAILVLMISVKNACESRWFSDQDSKELCNLANEILSRFCSTMNFNTQPNDFLFITSKVMSRETKSRFLKREGETLIQSFVFAVYSILLCIGSKYYYKRKTAARKVL